MGMFDFMKKNEEDDDWEEVDNVSQKQQTPPVSLAPKTGFEEASRNTVESQRPDFSTDYLSRLKSLTLQARENLRLRTQTAHEIIDESLIPSVRNPEPEVPSSYVSSEEASDTDASEDVSDIDSPEDDSDLTPDELPSSSFSSSPEQDTQP